MQAKPFDIIRTFVLDYILEVCYNHSVIRWVTTPTEKTYGVDEVRRDAASAFLVRSKTQKVTQ